MKNYMIPFVLTSLIILFSSCKPSKINTIQTTNSSKHFSVVQATVSSWIGGQPGIKGATVTIIIDNPTFELDSLYFKNLGTKLQKDMHSKVNMFVGNFTFSQHEDYILDKDPKKEYGNPAPDISLKNRFDLKPNEAIISYTFKGIKFYKKTTQLVEVEKKPF